MDKCGSVWTCPDMSRLVVRQVKRHCTRMGRIRNGGHSVDASGSPMFLLIRGGNDKLRERIICAIGLVRMEEFDHLRVCRKSRGGPY